MYQCHRTLRNIKVEARLAGDDITADNLGVQIILLMGVINYLIHNPGDLQEEHNIIINSSKIVIANYNSARNTPPVGDIDPIPLVVNAEIDASENNTDNLLFIPLATAMGRDQALNNMGGIAPPSSPSNSNSNYRRFSVEGRAYNLEENHEPIQAVDVVGISKSGGVIINTYLYILLCVYFSYDRRRSQR
jgi:hypothetical protein